MTSPVLPDPDMRADAVRKLIAKAQRDGETALTALGGMDLCTLGGPRHPVFPDALTSTWLRMDHGERDEFIEHSTSRMVRHNLLIPEPGSPTWPEYAMSPELGIVMAARCSPGFAVVASLPGTVLPSLSMFALSTDENQPGHVIVTETLMKMPGSDGKRRPNVSGTRLLGCAYGYHLFRVDYAADVLAGWAILPAEKRRPFGKEPARIVARYQSADDRQRIGCQILVRGDGATAHVIGADPADPDGEQTCDIDGLRAVMTRLLARDCT